MPENFDQTDRSLLVLLQQDATLSLEALAAAVSVSTNTCWRRIKRLEDTGVISGKVTLLDANALGVSQTVFVSIRTNDHSQTWLEQFSKTVCAIPEVVEFYRMAGDVDYFLKIQCSSVADYDRVYKSIISKIEIADVSASFAMEGLKYTTELPLPKQG